MILLKKSFKAFKSFNAGSPICCDVRSNKCKGKSPSGPPADQALNVIFTMVEFPEGVPIVNATNLPDPVKLPLPKALDNLEARITAGNFKIELPLTTGGYGSTFADTEFGLADVNRDPEPDCPTTAKPETTVATTSSSATTEYCSNEGNSGFSAG